MYGDQNIRRLSRESIEITIPSSAEHVVQKYMEIPLPGVCEIRPDPVKEIHVHMKAVLIAWIATVFSTYSVDTVHPLLSGRCRVTPEPEWCSNSNDSVN